MGQDIRTDGSPGPDATDLNRLTDQAYWTSVHGDRPAPPKGEPRNGLLRRIGRRLLRNRSDLTSRMYCEYHFWEILLPLYIQRNSEYKVIEIGSAPGTSLIEFHRHFGYEPYGVEYTATGASSNRQTFLQNGVNPANVIETDFFSAGFQNASKDQYHGVVSRGFIEHYTDLRPVIACHTNILKPGGHLIVTIPNLAGFNKYMVAKFAPELLPLHNLTIMNLPSFRRLFDRPELETLYCGYQGGGHLLMGAVEEHSMPRPLLTLLRRMQLLLNLAQSATGPIDTRFTSPYLCYIGRKRS